MSRSSGFAFGTKTFYRPIEAAIRWCGLLRFELRILEKLGDRSLPSLQDFPRWPLLRLYVDRIFDALAHDELPYGKAGIVLTQQRPSLDDPDLTVRHVDLKAWMSRFYPGDRPPFLFDEIERAVHPAVDVKMLSVLLIEREAAKVQLAQLADQFESLRTQHDSLVQDHARQIDELSDLRGQSQEPNTRSEATYLNIIGGLMTLLLGSSPSGVAYSSFRNTDAVVSALQAHFEGRPGLSERTLWSKLAQARRHLEGSR